MAINPTVLKALIDAQITNETVNFAITPVEVGGRMKDTIDYTTEQIANITPSQSGQGPQGPQGLQGLVGSNGTNGTNGTNGDDGINGNDGADGPQGPTGAAPVLTNTTIPGGDINNPVPITVNTLTSSNTSHAYYSVPNFTNDQSKIGTKIFIRNPTVWIAYVKGEPGVNSTFYTHTTTLVNGNESFQNPLAVASMRSVELTYLGNINGFERWASHLLFSPRVSTNGSFGTVSLALINSSNVNNDISVVTPTDATDNYMRLFTAYTNVGESVIVINGSQTNDIRLLGTPLYHHFLLGINSNIVPYIIPMGKAVRFTKGPSSFYFVAEIINYE